MAFIHFLPFMIVFTVLWIVIRAVVCLRQKRVDWRREAVLLLIWLDLAVIFRFTLFPMALADGHVQPLVFEAERAFPFRVNLVPLVHLLEYDSRGDILVNVLGNALMFVPTGVFLPIVYKRLDRFWKVAAAGAGISLGIEILQLPFAVRASDIDDLLLNTLGVCLGYALYALIARGKRRTSRS